MELTPRQLSERIYYNEYYNKYMSYYLEKVNTDVILFNHTRPFIAYWKIYDLVIEKGLSGKVVLDCGCGAGEHSIRLASMGAIVHGIDISERGIQIARRRAVESGLGERIMFSSSSIENLPFKDECFDIIFGIDILHHVNIEKAICEIRRTFKKNGCCFFKEWKEVEIFDKIRNSSFGLKLVPKIPKAADIVECAPEEKKLGKKELLFIKDSFPKIKLLHYYVFLRLSRLIKNKNIYVILSKIDYLLIKYIPLTKKLSGEIIIVLNK